MLQTRRKPKKVKPAPVVEPEPEPEPEELPAERGSSVISGGLELQLHSKPVVPLQLRPPSPLEQQTDPVDIDVRGGLISGGLQLQLALDNDSIDTCQLPSDPAAGETDKPIPQQCHFLQETPLIHFTLDFR